MNGGQPAIRGDLVQNLPADTDVDRAVSVFISSTSEDLKAHRDAARDAAIGAGMLPIMMEYFVAGGEHPPLDACLSKVFSGADLLVVIVAHRYGWVPPDQGADQHKSITWLECDQAVSEQKECLAFLVDDKEAWPDEFREEHPLRLAMQNSPLVPERKAERWAVYGRANCGVQTILFWTVPEGRQVVARGASPWNRGRIIPVSPGGAAGAACAPRSCRP